MPATNYLMRWTGPTQLDTQIEFRDTDGLLAALDRVTCDSIEAQASLRVDLYTTPTVVDPLLIQFTVGHPSLAGLLWHLDGETLVASDPRTTQDETAALSDHTDVVLQLPTTDFVHPSTVREILFVYVLTGQRADGLRWTILCQD